MDHKLAQWARKHPIALAICLFALSIGSSIVVLISTGANTASNIGDAFGIAATLLAGGALLAVAVSIHDLSENQDSQQKQIDALAAIARAITDPVVVARVEIRSDTAYHLYIENMGKSPAYDVRFDVDPKEGLYPYNYNDRNLADLDFIKHGIPVMAPGQRIAAYIASGEDMGNKRKQGMPVVDEFTLTVSYRCMPIGVPVVDPHLDVRQYHYTFNFSRQQRTFQPRGEVAAEIDRFRKLIEKGMDGGNSKRFRVTKKS